MSLSFSAWKMVTCCWLAVAIVPAVWAQTFAPQGGEYAVAGALPGDQTFPQAAVNSTGGYLVWQDNSVTTLGPRIRAARLDANLSGAGADFVVSSNFKSKATGDQQKPQVALLQNGGAVIVWQGGKSSLQQIYARFISADGSFVGRDVRVSRRPKNNQKDPQAATLADGTVMIVWSSDGEDGSLQGVFARHFSPTGKPLGSEFQVNQFTSNNQRTPTVAALSNGSFVIAWVSELQRGPSSVDVFARLFDGTATPVGDEFLVDTNTTNTCANPSAAGSAQGGFMVAWSQNGTPTFGTPSPGGIVLSPADTTLSTNGWDVFGCVFDGNGGFVHAPFRLNSYTFGDQFAPRLASVGADYMAVWTSLSQRDTNGAVDPWEGVWGQFISGGGTLALANDLHVNTSITSRQLQPTVASDGSRYLVSWSSFVFPGNFDIFAQIYSVH